MKKLIPVLFILFYLGLQAQSPDKISYQSVIRNSQGKLVQSSGVTVKISILQGSASGTPVYVEIHNTSTNVNGLVTLYIGEGITTGELSSIDWSQGPFYMKTETDPAGGSNFTVTGITQIVSVPYSLYSEKSGDSFSGDYNDLTNKPVTDGSETKIVSGFNTNVTGQGTAGDPYVVNYGADPAKTIIITSNQLWTVPQNITKIKVELWGGAGGGGGAGAYSYTLNNGGDGGSGGYVSKVIDVTPNSSFNFLIGNGGYPGSNAIYYYPGWYGDTDGGNGGDTYMSDMKAAGGHGGKRGSFSPSTVNGLAGEENQNGDVMGYAEPSNSNVLSIYQGVQRSYIHPRILTSLPGAGGTVQGYSSSKSPKQGESGCAVITLWEK